MLTDALEYECGDVQGEEEDVHEEKDNLDRGYPCGMGIESRQEYIDCARTHTNWELETGR
jgi:hypothetical protein